MPDVAEVPVVILAGGFGTRLAGEVPGRPKALIEIGGRPIVWHVARHYAHHGFRQVAIAVGHRGGEIRRFFADCRDSGLDCDVDVVETGCSSGTAGRVARIAATTARTPMVVANCDGLTDLDPRALLAFHESRGFAATIVATRPPPRFGELALDGDMVVQVKEKPQRSQRWISAGIYVFEPSVVDRVRDDATMLEGSFLDAIAANREMGAYRHTGFWDCMDTPADRYRLERAWRNGERPWATWERRR